MVDIFAMPKTTNPPAHWAGSTRMPPSSEFLHEGISLELNNAVSALRQSSRGVSREHLEVQLTASKWLIEALYQGYCCLPRLPVALPRRSNDYFGNASYKLPYRFVVIDRILQAAKKLNFIQVLRGRHNPFGKGVVTRLYPSGPLLTHFRQIGTVWQKLPPPRKDQAIFVNEARGGKDRRLAEIADHPDVVRMQQNLYKINLFLSKQCIYINFPDSAFDQPADKFVKPEASGSDAKKGSRYSLPTINFQSVFLSRIFTQDSFKVGHRLEGGRFYHGWWQRIRKEFRPRILINDFITAECDYSGMALSCLYALEGLQVGNQDPYEIGLKYTSKDDPRRDLVKQYVVAILNDESGKYRLNQQQLNVVGLTHQQLRDMVRKRHSAISHHFGTGVGLHLQYIDSCVAERVMLKFIRKKEVCLPIHDSFIVRRGLLKELEMVMRDEFRKQLRSSIGLKKTDLAISGLHIGQPDIDLPVSSVPGDPVMDIAMQFMTHISQYSILMGLHSSWEKQVFSPVELEGRSRMREEVFDFGKRNPV